MPSSAYLRPVIWSQVMETRRAARIRKLLRNKGFPPSPGLDCGSPYYKRSGGLASHCLRLGHEPGRDRAGARYDAVPPPARIADVVRSPRRGAPVEAGVAGPRDCPQGLEVPDPELGSGRAPQAPAPCLGKRGWPPRELRAAGDGEDDAAASTLAVRRVLPRRRQYLVKERTPQAEFAVGYRLGSRRKGAHYLGEGGGDRVHLSAALEAEALQAGFIEPRRRTKARSLTHQQDASAAAGGGRRP
jgi:hypothetical protein